MTTPALAAQSHCDQWAGSGRKRVWRVFGYGGALWYLCLITGECNCNCNCDCDCIDICFSKGTTCMQRLRCPWGDSASVSMVSATSQILMPDRHGMILAEIR